MLDNLNDSKGSDDINKNRPVTANTVEKKDTHIQDFTAKPVGALKQSNWQIKSVFDIKNSTSDKNQVDYEQCESDEERKRNEAVIRRGTLMNKSKEIESNIDKLKHQLNNRNDFF